ncbi:uncharacterized protein LOC132798014 [Drosophila nasuta]|uniref:uncharacterized protein LOC132798014 n=1 Tax=Drosophila nasuta TaxID=42062 RepID=UPI00295E4F30|nr:uncharacterized protein LOC132798014 [Drosophila nasuta]
MASQWIAGLQGVCLAIVLAESSSLSGEWSICLLVCAAVVASEKEKLAVRPVQAYLQGWQWRPILGLEACCRHCWALCVTLAFLLASAFLLAVCVACDASAGGSSSSRRRSSRLLTSSRPLSSVSSGVAGTKFGPVASCWVAVLS